MPTNRHGWNISKDTTFYQWFLLICRNQIGRGAWRKKCNTWTIFRGVRRGVSGSDVQVYNTYALPGKSINHSKQQWINQSINRSINRSVNQSINQSINRSHEQRDSHSNYCSLSRVSEIKSRATFFYIFEAHQIHIVILKTEFTKILLISVHCFGKESLLYLP